MARDQGRRDDPIEERLIDEGETRPESIVEAAAEGFERDQEDPGSPSRIERRLDREAGVEDPSHSVGSTRHGPGERGLDGGS